MTNIKTQTTNIKEIRTAVADYIATEGCSCCRDINGHNKAGIALAKLLGVRKYKDGSGYNFSKHASKK